MIKWKLRLEKIADLKVNLSRVVFNVDQLGHIHGLIEFALLSVLFLHLRFDLIYQTNTSISDSPSVFKLLISVYISSNNFSPSFFLHFYLSFKAADFLGDIYSSTERFVKLVLEREEEVALKLVA
jgi:hypothetical protein